MSPGVKVLMVWLQGVLSTISRGRASQSGSFIPELLVSTNVTGVSFLKSLWLLIFSRRTVVSIPCGPSALAIKEAAWGLARYAAIAQVKK